MAGPDTSLSSVDTLSSDGNLGAEPPTGSAIIESLKNAARWDRRQERPAPLTQVFLVARLAAWLDQSLN